MNLPVQLNLTKSAELPDVPLIMEFARTERQRQMPQDHPEPAEHGRGRSWRRPACPTDRKAALRAAFDATMKDPEFIAETKARGQEVNPVSGAAIDRLLAELYATPKDVVEETRKAIGGK